MLNNNISSMELNRRCKYIDINNFYNKLNELNMLLIKDSDSHDIDSDLYDELDFYDIDSKKVLEIIFKVGDYYK